MNSEFLNVESANFHHFGRLVFVPKWRFPAKQDLRRPPREKGKEKSAGAEEKERPPERATPLNRIFEKPSQRGEEDTEQGNKSK